MNKSLKIFLLYIFVFMTELFCCQTVLATDSDVISLPINNSNAAKKYIKDTKTEETEDFIISSNKIKIKEEFNDSATDSSKLATVEETNLQTVNASQYTNTIDDGSLPLFSTRPSNASATGFIPSANAMTSTLSLITSLIGIIIIALAISWFIQKKTGFGANNFGKVLGIIPLDNRRLIYIVYVAGKIIVLGVTESNINYLTEITDKDTIDTYKLKYKLTATELDKNFPFPTTTDTNNKPNNNINKSEEIIKLETERKSEQIKNEIEEERLSRQERLNNLIIK